MKKIVVGVFIVVLCAWSFQQWYHKHRRNTATLATSADAVQHWEFAELFDNNRPLSDLAVNGKYTVVEVYLDVCAYCRDFEAGFAKFQNKRSDVVLVRVHHPGRMNFKASGNTQEEQQQFVNALNAKIKLYEFCGTPHVEVFGPNQRPLAQDKCGKRDGTRYVWDWMAREEGISPKLPVEGVTRF